MCKLQIFWLPEIQLEHPQITRIWTFEVTSNPSWKILAQNKKQNLVGGIPTPLKNMKVSWDYYS